MNYRWILFDADNTLFDFDRSERFALETALAEVGVPLSDSLLALYHQINRAIWRSFEEGNLPKEDLRAIRFKQLFAAIKLDADPVKFSENYLYQLSTAAFLLEGARPLIDDLNGRFKLGIITNGLKEVQRPRFTKAGLLEMFDVIVVSDEIGHSKPHTGFFDYTFEKMVYPDKRNVLVVGDNLYSDIKGGKNYGLDTCWYNHHKQKNDTEIEPTYEIDNIQNLRAILGL